jgi:hypothetical protein
VAPGREQVSTDRPSWMVAATKALAELWLWMSLERRLTRHDGGSNVEATVVLCCACSLPIVHAGGFCAMMDALCLIGCQCLSHLECITLCSTCTAPVPVSHLRAVSCNVKTGMAINIWVGCETSVLVADSRRQTVNFHPTATLSIRGQKISNLYVSA